MEKKKALVLVSWYEQIKRFHKKKKPIRCSIKGLEWKEKPGKIPCLTSKNKGIW
jgi:hypothetical protein